MLAQRLREVLAEGRSHCLIEVDAVEKLASHPQIDEIEAIVLRVGQTRVQVLETFEAARSLPRHADSRAMARPISGSRIASVQGRDRRPPA